MDATFSITIVASINLAHVVIGGFFNEDAIRRFEAGRSEAYRQFRCPPNNHITLVDMREMRIQLQDTVRGFATILADPRWQSRRLAFVVEATLARSQIARAASGRNAAFFTNIADARAWLLESNGAPADCLGSAYVQD